MIPHLPIFRNRFVESVRVRVMLPTQNGIFRRSIEEREHPQGMLGNPTACSIGGESLAAYERARRALRLSLEPIRVRNARCGFSRGARQQKKERG